MKCLVQTTAYQSGLYYRQLVELASVLMNVDSAVLVTKNLTLITLSSIRQVIKVVSFFKLNSDNWVTYSSTVSSVVSSSYYL